MESTITKAQVKWVRSLQQPKYRHQTGLFVAEGFKCVQELQKAFELELLITEANASTTQLEQMSSLRSPQGVIGVFHQRATGVVPSPQGIILALDGVQDPGNMGTIIRTADWFGVHHIICSQDTADCYNPKVVQATMGALARVEIFYTDLTAWLNDYRQSGGEVYGTVLDGQSLYAGDSIRNHTQGVIIMGNEGNGICDANRNLITHSIRIPSYPQGQPTSESLNVAIATAVVLAEFRRLDQ